MIGQKTQNTCGKELYNDMISSFDYWQIVWTIKRYNKNISDPEANEMLNAFLQWVAAIPAISKGENNVFVMLETPVEEAFHAFVLNTRLYQKFCERFLGFFFHHDPLTEETLETTELGAKYTVNLLESLYSEDLHPLLKDWRKQLNNDTYKVACVGCKAPVNN